MFQRKRRSKHTQSIRKIMCTENKYQRLTLMVCSIVCYILSYGQSLIYYNNLRYSLGKNNVLFCHGFAADSLECDSIIFPDHIMVDGKPKRIYGIDVGAFEGKKSLRYVKFSDGMEVLRFRVFANCTNLEEIIIPSSLVRISPDAFENTNLKTIHVDPENKIYDSRGNSNALIITQENELVIGSSNAIIPSSVERIARMAFAGNRNLKSIHIPKSIKCVPYRCFMDCYNLTSVTFDDVELKGNESNALKIDNSAFAGCASLTDIILPQRLDTIGHCAFYGCQKLTKIHIPSNVKKIDGSIFGGCAMLEVIDVAKNNMRYDSRNNCNAICDTKTNTIISACKKTTIPVGIKQIGISAFGKLEIDTICIPKYVRKISRFAFADTKLHAIVIPKTVKEMEDGIFELCEDLEKIYLEHLVPPLFNDDRYVDRYLEDSPNITIYVKEKAYKKFKKHILWSKFKISKYPLKVK